MDKEGVDKNIWNICGIYIYIYIVEYHSSVKKNEIMLFAATWIDLESIMLSEIKQAKNTILYYLYVEYKIWHK